VEGDVNERLLVVEDDPAVLDLLRKALTMEGFSVAAVSEGSQAVEALRTGAYDAVVLDVMLPGKDGIEIMREIRASADLADTPVVMLTARADDESTWAGWRAGCDSYVPKPFDPNELAALLHRLISAREGA
jgi:DNA-binding response OmpR family regulator